jgi:two-component SAPR family response regulator
MGLDSFVLDPLMRIWVDYWKAISVDGKSQSEKWGSNYNNIVSWKEKAMTLDPVDAANWLQLWESIMEQRYGISREEYKTMREQLSANVGSFGKFEGKGWSKLLRRDYLGQVDA